MVYEITGLGRGLPVDQPVPPQAYWPRNSARSLTLTFCCCSPVQQQRVGIASATTFGGHRTDDGPPAEGGPKRLWPVLTCRLVHRTFVCEGALSTAALMSALEPLRFHAGRCSNPLQGQDKSVPDCSCLSVCLTMKAG